MKNSKDSKIEGRSYYIYQGRKKTQKTIKLTDNTTVCGHRCSFHKNINQMRRDTEKEVVTAYKDSADLIRLITAFAIRSQIHWLL